VSAHHFFAPLGDGDEVILRGDESRHAARVLRVREGEEITVADSTGLVVRARVTGIGDAEVRAEVIERTTHVAADPPFTVCPALPRGGKIEEIVEDLTELGVDRIVPWFAERSVQNWDERKMEKNLARWREVARAAAKQSKRPFLPIVEPTGLPVGEGVVVLHESADVLFRDVPGQVTAVITGPEGGLTPDEVAAFAAEGATIASLGPQVLRAQTAPVAAAVLALARMGRLG
jgi:16S rRNA (uracil1498-N3)-methyltransferase